MDSWSDLQAFVHSVRAGSFSAAAREAGTTPSAFSKRVAKLEEQLNTRLAVRGARGLVLTPEGQEFYQRIQRALEDVEEACVQASRSHEPRGLVRVSAQLDLGRDWLLPRMSSFARVHPQVHLEVSLSDKMVDLMSERFDVALRVGVSEDKRLTRRNIGRFRHILCASPAYLRERGTPRSVEELAGHVRLCYLRGNLHEDWVLPSGKRLVARGPYAADGNEALRQLALQGLGVARLPEFTVDGDVRRGTLTPLLREETREEGLPIGLVFPQGRQLASRVRAFVDFFAHEARRSLPQPA
ncbi:LysR substrate-binding domain-containing protein [Cystobacter fuscus]